MYYFKIKFIFSTHLSPRQLDASAKGSAMYGGILFFLHYKLNPTNSYIKQSLPILLGLGISAIVHLGIPKLAKIGKPNYLLIYNPFQ